MGVIMEKFKNIILVGKHKNYEIGSFVQKVANYLIGMQCNVFLDDETKNTTKLDYPVATINEKYDLILAIGGDGTMMGAARKWGVMGIPLLGINQGRVGFLTDIASEDVFERLLDVFKGKFTVEKRDILSVSVTNGKDTIANNLAINDVVVGRGPTGRLKEFSLFLNEEFISSQQADGIIVASSTGSTAYALASGGSIIHPSAEVLTIVPICPQSLSNRPLIVSSKNEIKIFFSGNETVPYSVDGIDSPNVNSGHHFLIKKHDTQVTFIHPDNYSYFEGLRKKLNWC